jgi:hypothetical protein
MKSTFATLLLLMLIGTSLSTLGQITKTSNPEIHPLDPYVGIWSSANDSSIFQIELRKVSWSNGLIVLMGDYMHSVEGKELINTKQHPGFFWILGDKPIDSTSIHVIVVDKITEKALVGNLRSIDSTTIEWKLSIKDGSTSEAALSVPLTLRFKRVTQ